MAGGGLEQPEGGVELAAKAASGSARATLRRGWGNPELGRGGFGPGGCSGFSSIPSDSPLESRRWEKSLEGRPQGLPGLA